MCKLLFQTRLTEKIGIYQAENQVRDIQLDRDTNHARVGSIFLGKVRNIDRSIEAAFIEIEKDIVGFLPKSEYPFKDKFGSALTDGASVIVQVIKEAYQDKGPRLTANITFPGASMVYLPYSAFLACSKKLSEQQREKMEGLLKPLLEDQEGLIIRTQSVDLADEVIISQLEQLRKQFATLVHNAKSKKAPFPLLTTSQVPDQMINQYQSKKLTEIIFDQMEVMRQMQQKYPDLAEVMSYSQMPVPDNQKTVDQLLEEAVHPTVRTKEGIAITIEQTEGLTVIDVDSSQFQSRQNKRITLYQINQKAVRPIAAEIQKRNLSGIILIDFLKMKKKEEHQHILQLLRKELLKDPIRTEVYGFTKLGLVEMTRKREHVGLLQLMTERATTASAERTMESYAYQFERELDRWNHTKTEAIIVACSQEFDKLLQEKVYPNVREQVTLDVYKMIDHSISNYQIVRSGSWELIHEYMEQHSALVIDKVL
ncbi:hypothetical protein F9U64_11400 [Gracilibacillus oryzae]|uniref:S1 motif domain-containing protein n=1 Tax=Gracilibacillus oryzae TaxID=1672701 RepID=A0A7C8KQ30_9BACI|nr:ribonuclease E/G [Gracilibacillus oryzae]KAB8134734.1 hypothetical protein F9U64_11400 [Gracilibacillus oryzae]